MAGLGLIDALREDHRLIERVVGAFATYVGRRTGGGADLADAARFFTFFRAFVGGYHHDREERVLFPALTGALELPADRGPVAALTGQHHELAAILDALEPLLCTAGVDADTRARCEALARRYAHGLWAHIDAEDSVLFPESEARLVRAGLSGLQGPAPTVEEDAARADGEQLAHAYPAADDPTAVRGQGCIVCPSYGVTCDGLEREWWTESEWDELDEHMKE